MRSRKQPNENDEKRGHAGWDLWKPGPLSGHPKNPANKKIARRITRHVEKRKLPQEVSE